MAEVAVHAADWFGPFLPHTLVLGDPGAHDAIIHAVQACIPHARLVPVALERLVIEAPLAGPVTVAARERWSDGGSFVYDIVVTDSGGRLCERWEGLTLRRVGAAPSRGSWPPALLVPYLERRIGEESGERAAQVALIARGGARRQASDDAIADALGAPTTVRRRADGRPGVVGEMAVSTSHLGGYTLALTGRGPVGCDVEAVVRRPEQHWANLLGRERLELARVIAAKTGAGIDTEATRAWAAIECLKKAGLPISQPLTLASSAPDGWIVLRGGGTPIATFVTRLPAIEEPVAIALLVGALAT